MHCQNGTSKINSTYLTFQIVLLFVYVIGSQTGVRVPPGLREVVQGVRGEKMSAITENGRNLQNVPFETELQLSDGNILLCIKIIQIPLYFVLQGCISFL